MLSTTPRRAGLTASVCAAAIVCLPLPSLAQDEPGLFTLLGRIIFGAGAEKVAIDTPQAVTVIDQADLDRAQPTTISDLFAGVPGVQAAGASVRALGQAFNIRGIGNTEQTASEARIIVTVDGAPKFFEQYRMGSFFADLDLFKRVEVLRGPASSTLYGSGAIGGVVNFTTKDAADFIPEGKTSALRFKTALNSNGEGKRLGVIYATTFGEAGEMLGALNFGTSHGISDGTGAEIAGSAYDQISGLAKARFRFGNDLEQSVTLSYTRTDSDLDRTAVAQTGGTAVIPVFGFADIHTVDDTLTLAYNFAPAANPLIDLDVLLSYTDTSVEKNNFTNDFGLVCAIGQTQVLCPQDASYETLSLKVENTSTFGFGDWQNYLTVGVQLSEQERRATSSLGAFGFHPEGTDRRTGIYAQGEFVWRERLTLIPGIRVDFGDRSPGAAAAAAGALAVSDTAVSPKLAALYKIDDRFGVFGSIARTERMPTLDELFSTEASTRGLPSLNLEKEEAENFEFGVTYQNEGLLSEGDALQVKATLFHNDVTNLIARSATPAAGDPAVTYFTNITDAKLWGGEIEASYDAERWFGQLAYSKVRSKDRTTGLTLAETPAENVALTLGLKMPQRDLVMGWRAAYFDGITTSSAATTAAHYDTHDIFLTWTPQQGALAGLELNFAVENVFDATYRNNLAQDNAAGRSFKLSLAKAINW